VGFWSPSLLVATAAEDRLSFGGQLPTYSRSPFETGMNVMLSGNRHWLEYDSVALVVLFVGIGFVALIVLGI
jgi:hypothetical protein